MLTLEQINEARQLRAISMAGGELRRNADQSLTVWFHTHAEALLEAAERQAALSHKCDCQGGPFTIVGCPLCVDKEP